MFNMGLETHSPELRVRLVLHAVSLNSLSHLMDGILATWFVLFPVNLEAFVSSTHGETLSQAVLTSEAVTSSNCLVLDLVVVSRFHPVMISWAGWNNCFLTKWVWNVILTGLWGIIVWVETWIDMHNTWLHGLSHFLCSLASSVLFTPSSLL